jgi:peptidoglycan hydrolase-like protein with peptidoglycan-binding domain
MKLQVALTAAGYDLSEPDSQYGPQTTAVVRSFQADQGLLPTGETNEALFNLAISEAAKAPACNLESVSAVAKPLRGGFSWLPGVDCAPGWAIATDGAEDINGADYRLFRVRGSQWQEVNSSGGRTPYATYSLPNGTALSRQRFNQLFGAADWPGRAASADQVAKAIMITSQDVGTGPEANEIAAVWLDGPGQNAFDRWFNDLDGELVGWGKGGVLGRCQLVANATFFAGPHWECSYTEINTARWIIAIDQQLSQATMNRVH